MAKKGVRKKDGSGKMLGILSPESLADYTKQLELDLVDAGYKTGNLAETFKTAYEDSLPEETIDEVK